MIELYYYIPTADVEYVVDCGLKLSRWFDKEVVIEGENKKCISALLNPKDDIAKFRSDNFTCIKLEVPEEYCFVADSFLYSIGLHNQLIMEKYISSVIPAKSYMFGSFRLPECLVICTVIEGQIKVLNKVQDSPILFGDTEELYVNNIVESLKGKNEYFYDTVLYFFFKRLADIGRFTIIEDHVREIAVFIGEEGEKIYTFRIPDLTKYDIS